MRGTFIVYKNSVPATLCNLIGSLMAIYGFAIMIRSSFTNGLLLLALGIGMMFLASWISDKSEFPAWKRKVRKSGLIPEIQRSVPTAIQVYQTNPCPQALNYIRTLNPQAAEIIEQVQASRSKS